MIMNNNTTNNKIKKSVDEASASILLELKNSSDDTSSPPPSSSPSPLIEEDGHCNLSNCLLCQRGVPSLLVRSPTWASIMRVVFYCLQYDNSSKYFFNLKTDVYGFMTTHWKKLCLDKKRSDNWHKQIQDMLSHSKNLFESGMERYKQNGFWRMKQALDPWTIRKDRKTNKLKRSNSNEEPDSPARKRARKDEGLSSDDEDLQIDSSDEKDIKPQLQQINSGTSLEEELKCLKENMIVMTKEFNVMKEELKKRDKEVEEKTVSYYHLMEQFKALQQQYQLQQHHQQQQQIQQHQQQQLQQQQLRLRQELLFSQKQWSNILPPPPPPPTLSSPPPPLISQMRYFFPTQQLLGGAFPASPNKHIDDDDEYYRGDSYHIIGGGGEVQVPQMMRLSPLSVSAHL